MKTGDVERSTARATWLAGIAAVLSVIATIGLGFLAVRQETATYYSNLLTKQIEFTSDLLAQLAVGQLASNPAYDVLGSVARIEQNRDDLSRVIRAAESVRIVSPTRIQSVADHIIMLAQKILIGWPNLLASQGDGDTRKLRLWNMDADYKELAKIRHELEVCVSHAFLNHTAITDESIKNCDLHVGERDPMQAMIDQSNTPACRKRVTCRMIRMPDGSLLRGCPSDSLTAGCGYPP
jgi:hypothetical protein